MPYFRRRFYRRRSYRRPRRFFKWSRKFQAASSLRTMSLPIRKTLSVTFTVAQGSFTSNVLALSAMYPLAGSDSLSLVSGNQPFSSLCSIFDEVRFKSFSIQITPGLNSGYPPGALLICPDRRYRFVTGGVQDSPTPESLLVSPSTQVVGFTQFSTLQIKRSLYAANAVERQSYCQTNQLIGSNLEFNPAFYLMLRLAGAPSNEQTVSCTVTLTGTAVFRNPTN
uniref:Putative replication-associated protein n=1 Tax=Cressdnaviricota sp. TaxID=2748378 RepID=A0A6M3YQ48_9VIRU|nr:MAG: putative replication-associated protein [Cressdnaviricota sp.]